MQKKHEVEASAPSGKMTRKEFEKESQVLV